jgi:hypothetical protein
MRPGQEMEAAMAHVADLGFERKSWRMLGRQQGRRIAPVPFPELVHQHALWRDALEGRRDHLAELDRTYHDTRKDFERGRGEIVNEFWCSRLPSAVCLTSMPGLKGPKLAFHRVSDWATEGLPEIAALLHRCDELATRATQVLTGVRERICLQLVISSASHLLSLADGPTDAKRAAVALEQEKKCLDEAEAYYHEAATGQAQVVYFTGIALSMAIIAALALLGGFLVPLPGIDDREFYGCLGAGAVGAVVSVMQRINSGHFDLEYDVGRAYVRFLGALRPAMGAIFGLAIYFAINGDILKLFALPPKGTTGRLFALLVVAFLAGFSERWAQDTLTSLVPAAAEPTGKPRAQRKLS